MYAKPKRSLRRYVAMTIASYQSASWLTRVVCVMLLCAAVMKISDFGTKVMIVVNDKTGEVQIDKDVGKSPVEVRNVLDSLNETSDLKDREPGNVPIGAQLDKNEEFGHPLGNPEKRLPDTLIIGARKGGTRALITFLAMHPQIVTTGDEVQFFNNNETYSKGLEWYREQMPPARSDQTLIEKTAEYFHVLWVPERVQAMNPDIKILLVVRDPFIRMVSDYNFLRRFAATNEVEGYEFPELTNTLEELAFNNETKMVNRGYGALHRSKYYRFFSNWLRHFPRDQIHVINGDRLALDNPAFELSKVEQFLNIDKYFTEDFFYKNEEKGFYCITELGCLGKEKGHKQPEFDPEFISKVRGFLRPLNALFYNMVGYDFHWE